jgi:hypothetical protein
VLGTQETFCIVIAGFLERDSFDLLLPEFDKPWVIHLRETCCCSTNLCTWRPNTVYKNRRVRRHHRSNATKKFFFCLGSFLLRMAWRFGSGKIGSLVIPPFVNSIWHYTILFITKAIQLLW